MSNEGRKGVTAIGLMQLPYLVNGRFFHIEGLAEHLEDYTPELEKLAHSGLVVQDEVGEWRIGHQGFLWWLADELRRHVRSQDEFASWLQRESMGGMLSRGEKEMWGNAAKKVVTAVTVHGVPLLIQGFVGKLMG